MLKEIVVTTAVVTSVVGVATTANADTNNPYAGHTSWNEVAPTGLEGSQSWIDLDTSQKANAKVIVQEAYKDHVSAYGAVIAVATALQESKLINYTDAVDHDSLGVFQQRPSCGWGSPSQIENPVHATDSFRAQLSRTHMLNGS